MSEPNDQPTPQPSSGPALNGLGDGVHPAAATALLSFTKWEPDGVSKLTIDLAETVTSTHQRWLKELGLPGEFAVVTACNPHSKVQSEEANDRAMARLKAMLDEHQIASDISCAGCSRDLSHYEPGYALQLDRAHALELARLFEQSALYFYDGTRFYLVPTSDEGRVVALPA